IARAKWPRISESWRRRAEDPAGILYVRRRFGCYTRSTGSLTIFLEGTAMISAVLLSGALAVGFPAQTGAPAGRTDLEAYKAAAAKAGRDPDAHVKLALWCEAHGL